MNKHFKFLKQQLVLFIKKQSEEFDSLGKVSELILDLFKNNIKNEWELQDLADMNPDNINETLILNFNYTNVINQYMKKLTSNHFKHIQIHGNINNYNSIVLGYGDKLDESYQII